MKQIFTLLTAVVLTATTYAQVGIGTTNPNTSAALDITSTTQGFLPPRMTYAQRQAISSPATGLMIYCTDCGNGEPQYYSGAEWKNMIGGTATPGNTVPDAPTIGTATAGIGQASVPFTAPASDGGSAITSYTATSNPGNITGTISQAGSGTITVTGLTSGTAYTFTVTATNSVGTSAASAASNSVTPATVPDAPTIGTATAGNGQAFVPFTAPASDGGSAITSYTATSNPGNITGTISQAGSGTITVTGLLTDGTDYTFTVTATNSVGTSAASAASNPVTPTPIKIGDSYQGGIVAYIFQVGDPGYVDGEVHGLIAAQTDQSSGAEWGCSGITISGADGIAIGTGAQNTIDIEAGCSTVETAADICANLELLGYTDWYLPSKDELKKLYLNINAVGGFASAYYWSSTENNNNNAWRQNFGNGYQIGTNKNYIFRVRAVRSF